MTIPASDSFPADQRAVVVDKDDSYAGDVGPRLAFETVHSDAESVLVDVRTPLEWDSVGVPDVPGMVFVEWIRPDGSPNPMFLDELSGAEVTHEMAVYFLCRSGQRSGEAARLATSDGYRRAFNVAQGFEGPPDASGKRTVAGWKNDGLPWRFLP